MLKMYLERKIQIRIQRFGPYLSLTAGKLPLQTSEQLCKTKISIYTLHTQQAQKMSTVWFDSLQFIILPITSCQYTQRKNQIEGRRTDGWITCKDTKSILGIVTKAVTGTDPKSDFSCGKDCSYF